MIYANYSAIVHIESARNIYKDGGNRFESRATNINFYIIAVYKITTGNRSISSDYVSTSSYVRINDPNGSSISRRIYCCAISCHDDIVQNKSGITCRL